MNDEALRVEVDMLAQRIAEQTRHHRGRLSALHLAAGPREIARVRDCIQESLFAAGIEFVDVVVTEEPGPLRVVRQAYEA